MFLSFMFASDADLKTVQDNLAYYQERIKAIDEELNDSERWNYEIAYDDQKKLEEEKRGYEVCARNCERRIQELKEKLTDR